MNTVPATRDQVRKHCGDLTAQALAIVDGDKTLAVYGSYLDDSGQVLFSWISDELKQHPKVIVRAYREFMKTVQRSLPTFAVCDLSIPKSDLFMLHLGFRPFNGKVWKLGSIQ